MILHQVPDSRFAASYHSYRPLPVFVVSCLLSLSCDIGVFRAGACWPKLVRRSVAAVAVITEIGVCYERVSAGFC